MVKYNLTIKGRNMSKLVICNKCYVHREVRLDSTATLCKSCMGKSNATKHGLHNHRDYSRWESIIQRTENPKASSYKNYGGRGITMCDSWRYDPVCFIEYIKQLPNYDKEGYTLDRIENDGNYEPDNLRWASRSMQALNSRVRCTSKSGVKGVNWCNTKGKWIVYKNIDNKRKQIGQFIHLHKAIKCSIEYK